MTATQIPPAKPQLAQPHTLSDSDLLALLQSLLADGVACRFAVSGNSMLPALRAGDVVTVEPAPTPPAPGSIAVFQDSPTPRVLVHRILGYAGTAAVARGDNRAVNDAPVSHRHILGIVTRAERNGRPVRLGVGFAGRLFAFLSRVGILRRLNRFLP